MLVQPWRIEMLGGLRACRGEQTLTRFRTQKEAVLLAYLAFYPEKPHTRDELLAILWPNDDIDAARNRLRVGLTGLRHQLEPPGTPSGAVIETDRRIVRLRPEAFTSDVAEFSAALDAAQRTEEESERTRALVAAAEVYHGDLLPGFFEEWVMGERERLAQAYLQTLHRLTRSLAQAKEYERALFYARRAAQSDPMREEAHRDVMRLCVAVGQPSAALQQFAELKRLLEETPGMAPSPASQQLADQIAENLGRPSGSQARPQIPATGVTVQWQTAGPPTSESKASPPSAATTAQQSRLPVFLTRFFGREEELALLTELLSDSPVPTPAPIQNPKSKIQNRLITLTGPGGTGKTRLAIAGAESLRPAFADNVWFVPLADLADPHLIADAIVSTLRLPRDPRLDGLQQTVEALSELPALLVLDNFEHLVEGGAALIAEMLARLPHLTCLVTSRRSLGIPGEREMPIAPLPIPELKDEGGRMKDERTGISSSFILHPSSLLSVPSVRLFIDRAQAVRPEFQLTARNTEEIVELCRELEGIPLAIELAAAQVRVLTPAQMRAHLARRFDLLVNRRADKDVRHRSMRAVIETSYHLLTPQLRRLFAQLSVFRGGWTLEAAEAVCAADEGVERLCMDSLIVAEEDAGEMRFRMLETLREFAAEQLTSEDRDVVSMRHSGYFCAFATRANGHIEAAERVEIERDNLAAALDDLLARNAVDDAAGLCNALAYFWERRGRLREGQSALRRCLARRREIRAPQRLADLLSDVGWLAHLMGDGETAIRCLQESLSLHEPLHNDEGLSSVLNNLAIALQEQGQLEEAGNLFQRSLDIARRLGDRRRQALRLSNLGRLAIQEGRYAEGRAYLQESRGLFEALDDPLGTAACLCNLADLALSGQEWIEARVLSEQCLRRFQEIGDRRGIALALTNLAEAAMHSATPEEADAHIREALAICDETGMRQLVPVLLETRARSLCARSLWADGLWAAVSAERLRAWMGLTRSDEEDRTLTALSGEIEAQLEPGEARRIRAELAARSGEEILALSLRRSL